MSADFITALKSHQSTFGVNLAEDQAEKLRCFYSLVTKHSELLHLVAPCSAEEFAIRHVLESLTLLEWLPPNSQLIDVGTGAGLPSIPCLIAGNNLSAQLIESKPKKVQYLKTVISELGLSDQATIFNRQFEELPSPRTGIVICRALDKFTQKLPKLLQWSKFSSARLFFGGPNLREELEKNKLRFIEKLLPLSERRFLFIINK